MLFCAEPHGQCTDLTTCALWLLRTLGVKRALKYFEAMGKIRSYSQIRNKTEEIEQL